MKFEVVEDAGIKVLRVADGTEYIVGENADLIAEYELMDGYAGESKGYKAVYDVKPILNETRSYGIELKPDGKFRIVTAEELVKALLK